MFDDDTQGPDERRQALEEFMGDGMTMDVQDMVLIALALRTHCEQLRAKAAEHAQEGDADDMVATLRELGHASMLLIKITRLLDSIPTVPVSGEVVEA